MATTTKTTPRAAARPRTVHPKFRKAAERPTGARKKELMATIAAALRELIPGVNVAFISSHCYGPVYREPWPAPPLKVPVDALEKAPAPRPGTVAAVAAKVEKALRVKAAEGYSPDADPKRLGRFTSKGLVYFRAMGLVDTFAYWAGEIPAAEFGPPDWAAFVGRLERWRDAKEMKLLADGLREAGLRIDR